MKKEDRYFHFKTLPTFLDSGLEPLHRQLLSKADPPMGIILTKESGVSSRFQWCGLRMMLEKASRVVISRPALPISVIKIGRFYTHTHLRSFHERKSTVTEIFLNNLRI